MNTFVEPTHVECTFYYYGLPSQPKLVARSSTEPITLRDGGDPFWQPNYAKKSLCTVGCHPIVDTWSHDSPNALRGQIVSLLDARQVDWQAIDVLRIGYSMDDDASCPVVLFISVNKNSLSKRDGYLIASQCKMLLTQHGLPDVECEIKESSLIRLASSTISQLPGDARIQMHMDFKKRLCDCLGNSIAIRERPTHAGSNCLYLRDMATSTVYALTCRHVCFTNGELEDDAQRLPSIALTRSCPTEERRMIQLGANEFDRNLNELRSRVQSGQKELDKMTSNSQIPGRPSHLISSYQSMVDSLTDVISRFEARKEPEDRVFGNLAYFREHAVRDRGYLSDWALIRLDPSRYERPLASLTNRVYVDEGPWKDHPLREADSTIRLCGVEQVQHTTNSDGSKTYTKPEGRVFQCGAASTFSMGYVNEVKSVTRSLFRGARSFTSLEWCVLAPRKVLDRRYSAFSFDGDSGACVWNEQGRIFGMMTSGIGQDVSDTDRLRVADATYVTPMAWILEDMADCGLEMEVL